MSYSNPIVGGNVLLRQEIRSENYVAGVSGWRITRDGDAEFFNIVARGDITADRLHVPFVNQLGQNYAIDIGESNPDQPGILFEFEGNGVTDWNDGVIQVEGFEGADPFGEMTIRPLRAGNPGTSPNITLRSTRVNTGGQLIIGGSANTNGDRPLLQVGSAFDVTIPALRHEYLETSTDVTGLTAVSPAVESDTIFRFTMPYPRSGIVTIVQNIQAQNDTLNARTRMTFEIRDNNVAGTIRASEAPSTCANVKAYVINQADNASWTRTATGLPTTGTMFIRALYSVSAGTGIINDRAMTVIPSP